MTTKQIKEDLEVEELCLQRLSSLRPHVSAVCLIALVRYLAYGLPTGDFIRAVLENNLIEAFSRADDDNRQKMVHWASAMCNAMPSKSWGSPEAVKTWIARGGLKGDLNGN